MTAQLLNKNEHNVVKVISLRIEVINSWTITLINQRKKLWSHLINCTLTEIRVDISPTGAGGN
jgi:hypothetical protein